MEAGGKTSAVNRSQLMARAKILQTLVPWALATSKAIGHDSLTDCHHIPILELTPLYWLCTVLLLTLVCAQAHKNDLHITAPESVVEGLR